MDETTEAQALLASLTDKQRQVLELLAQHKSSKEIARTLGISPYTVDQRITAAKHKLQAGGRGEVARLYRRLSYICEKSAYEFPHVPEPIPVDDKPIQTESADPVFTFADAAVIEHHAPWDVEPVRTFGLEAFDRQFGIAGRCAAIVLLAASLALILLAMVAMAKTLSELF